MALRYSTSVLLLATAHAASSQPTITSAFNPLPGDNVTRSTCEYTLPGPGGSNQTWDFSALVCGQSSTFTWVSPASTGFASLFPNATVAQDAGGNVWLYSCTAAAYEQLGMANNGMDLVYTNTLKTLQYPFTNGNTFTDTFSGDANYDGQTLSTRSGSITVTADGYGTVIIPGGTVTNTLRIHSVLNYSDQPSNGGTPVQIHIEDYQWLKPGLKTSIVYIADEYDTVDSDTTQVFHYLDIGSVDGIGFAELTANAFGVEAWPNPASQSTDLVFGTEGGLDLRIDLLDASGREVRSWTKTTTASGIQRKTLDLSGVAPGPHLVRITDQVGNSGTCRLVTF